MTSRSSSRSEGEYLSSDSETKATRQPSYRHDSRVNRPTRPSDSARPRRQDSRSRSRSPYRAPRGEKRRREEDLSRSRHDPRTFKVKYENDRHTKRDPYSDRSAKRSRARSRSRSRSPFRHSRESTKMQSVDAEPNQSVSTQDLDGEGVPKGETHAKKMKQITASQPVNGTENSVSRDLSGNPAGFDQKTSAEDKTEQLLDPAAIIEARRKRREAIKNQYRGQAPSLLVQALHIGAEAQTASEATTPNRSVSPAPMPFSMPSTPKSTVSEPQSPADFTFANNDLANEAEPSPKNADEPSAADYDPTIDMQEERARHDKKLFKEDDLSQEEADRQVPVHASSIKETQAKAGDFDMFAEDAEDDMFADQSVTTLAAPKTSAQALDINLMDNWDDAEGYYNTIPGELVDNRYKVTQNLGRGMFASVIRATDTKNDRSVAIKIVRNNESMKKAGIKEVDILRDLSANDPEDRKHIVRLLRSFDHKGHLCMVFENMSMNLREVLKKFGRDVGINLKAIRAYAQQLFLGLSLLRKCQYLHADLKPDNILVNETRNIIKIADLGSASPITENATAPYLISRFYRAPEVILGIEYDYGIDMWSTGCTLFELYTGKILFTGRNNNNMLRTIMECRGKFPHKLLRKGTLTYDYFDDLLNFRAQEQDKLTGRIVTKMIDIKAKPIRDLRSRLIPKDKKIGEQERKELELFLDLLDKCLDLRPDKRITPVDALKHPFITRAK